MRPSRNPSLSSSVLPGGGGQASEGAETQGEAVKKQWEAGPIPVSPDLLSRPDLVSLLRKWAPLLPEPSCCGVVRCGWPSDR